MFWCDAERGIGSNNLPSILITRHEGMELFSWDTIQCPCCTNGGVAKLGRDGLRGQLVAKPGEADGPHGTSVRAASDAHLDLYLERHSCSSQVIDTNRGAPEGQHDRTKKPTYLRRSPGLLRDSPAQLGNARCHRHRLQYTSSRTQRWR